MVVVVEIAVVALTEHPAAGAVSFVAVAERFAAGFAAFAGRIAKRLVVVATEHFAEFAVDTETYTK